MSNTVLAGIVLYNPDIERLKMNLKAVSGQVSEILLVNNGSENTEQIQKLIQEKNNIYLLDNKKNIGIAAALNEIGDYALQKNIDMFLTLDQDSVICENMVSVLSRILEDEKVGVSCPYIDRKHNFTSENKVYEVETAITSGSLVKTSVWKLIGGFWEYLFIDEVDHEFCYQVRQKGYKIMQTREVSVDHIIGVPFTKTILGHTFHPTNHSPFRRYYIARNDLIMAHLYPKEKSPFPHRKILLFRIAVSILFCESQKSQKLKAIFKGIKDATKWNYKNKNIKERRGIPDND